MSARGTHIDEMCRAARAAGDALLEHRARGDALEIREKGASDFVTDADLKAQSIIRDVLGAFPEIDLVCEEDPPRGGIGTKRFLVDPLDGTTNYIRGIPHFAVAIGLEVDAEVVAGVVVDPSKREVFVAERGRGAWLGDRRLRVSGDLELARSLIATGIPHRGGRDHGPYLEALGGIAPDVAGIRRFGAAALDLAYVAAGRFEVFFERGLAPWDLAAGSLLILESGGIVTKTDGSKLCIDDGDVLAASSTAIHHEMVRRLGPLHRASLVR